MTIQSDFANLSFVLEKAEKELKMHGIGEDVIFSVRTALGEAIVNAIKHGNKMNKELTVKVKMDIGEDKIEIEVEDQGEGFNYQNLPDPTEESSLYKLSGRGVFLIKSMMNKVEFFDRGRIIKMIKFLNKGGRNEDK